MLRDGQYDAFWWKASNVPWNPKPKFSRDFKRLMWDMLKFDPKDRITTNEACERSYALNWHIHNDYESEEKNKKEREAYMVKRYEEIPESPQVAEIPEAPTEVKADPARSYMDELKRLAMQFKQDNPTEFKAIEQKFIDYDKKKNA